jgi:ketol-acid reductoisomerase
MRYSVSDTAQYGDFSRGRRVINDDTRQEMKKILTEVQDGSFALEWILENQANRPRFNAVDRMEKSQLLETVGKELRRMMHWIDAKEGF